MKRAIGDWVLRSLSGADERTVAKALRANLAGRRIAVGFHRVAATPSKLAMPAGEIDALIRFLQDAAGPLTVCFDDGYAEAAEYVLSRASRFPDCEWLFFVCPEKTELGAGFRWDVNLREDVPLDLAAENLRPDLRVAGTALASIDACRAIARLPNAALGNHTNVHHRAALMPAEQWREEVRRSTAAFARLFGPQRHFAFPYGVPGVDFSAAHVRDLRALGDFLIWSTEPRPFTARERSASAVLPRFAVDGTRSWKETAVHIALHALRTRIQGEARP